MIDALKRFWAWLTITDTPVKWPFPPVYGSDAVHTWKRELCSDD